VPAAYNVEFRVKYANGKRATFEVRVFEAWAPQGALHFLQLVQDNFFDKNLVFRVLPWMVCAKKKTPQIKKQTNLCCLYHQAQFGLNNYPANSKWIRVEIGNSVFNHS
jgi:cyclophilin family peptidyl-prolyl cis-trans isomerase